MSGETRDLAITRSILTLCVAGILLGCFSGCSSKRYFTKQDAERYAEQLPNLQFYVDRESKFSRIIKSGEAGVSDDHRIRTYEGESVEELVLRPYTPGIFVRFDRNSGLFSFEQPHKGKERVLRFSADKSGKYVLDVNSEGHVKYSDTSYLLGEYKEDESIKKFVFIKYDPPYLMIESKKIKELEKKSRELPGVKL